MDDQWLPVEDNGECLGVRNDTVYTWVSSKGMAGHHVGQCWKIRTEEIDDWAQAGGAPNGHRVAGSRERAH